MLSAVSAFPLRVLGMRDSQAKICKNKCSTGELRILTTDSLLPLRELSAQIHILKSVWYIYSTAKLHMLKLD